MTEIEKLLTLFRSVDRTFPLDIVGIVHSYLMMHFIPREICERIYDDICKKVCKKCRHTIDPLPVNAEKIASYRLHIERCFTDHIGETLEQLVYKYCGQFMVQLRFDFTENFLDAIGDSELCPTKVLSFNTYEDLDALTNQYINYLIETYGLDHHLGLRCINDENREEFFCFLGDRLRHRGCFLGGDPGGYVKEIKNDVFDNKGADGRSFDEALQFIFSEKTS